MSASRDKMLLKKYIVFRFSKHARHKLGLEEKDIKI